MNFIQKEAIPANVLEMISSEWWNKVMDSQDAGSEYRSGAMFGASMAAIYVSVHAPMFSNEIKYCKDCFYRKYGHPDNPWLPCSHMKDEDCCTYYEPNSINKKLDSDSNTSNV